MQKAFVEVLNLSITSAWLILAVLCVRAIIKQIAPRWTACLLWALVALCLLVPFTFESPISIIPSREPIVILDGESSSDAESAEGTIGSEKPSFGKVQINSGFSSLDERLNAIIESYAEKEQLKKDEFQEEESPGINIMLYASYAWIAGAALMLGYFAINFISLKLKLKKAMQYKENVYLNDAVGSPFLFGFIKPKIYLPLDVSEESEEYVLAHENAHMKRFDHIIKPFAFILLAIHWFNPLVWVAYLMLGRDIEYACDEKVIKGLNETERKAYATALLECGVKAVGITCPVAFGEISVKNRILKTLNYKKPMLWVILIIMLATAILALAFLSSPKTLVKMDDETTVAESEESEDAINANDVLGVWYTDGHSLMLEDDGEGVCHSEGMLIPLKWTTDAKSIHILLSEEHKGGVELPTEAKCEISEDGSALTIGDTVYTSTYQSKPRDDIDGALVGTWYGYSSLSGEYTMVLNADGSGRSTGISLYAFTWSVKDGDFLLKMKVGEMGYTQKYKDYKIDGDKLTFKYSGVRIKYSKNKLDLCGNDMLLGDWELDTGEEEKHVFTFDASGYASYQYENYLWKESDGKIILYTDVPIYATADELTETIEVPYTLNGNTLTITMNYKTYELTLVSGSRPVDVLKSDKEHPLGGDTAVKGKWDFDITTSLPDSLNVGFQINLKSDGKGSFNYLGSDIPISWYTDEESKVLAVYFENGEETIDLIYGEYHVIGDSLYVNEKSDGLICLAKKDAVSDTLYLEWTSYVNLELFECYDEGNETQFIIFGNLNDLSDLVYTIDGKTVASYDTVSSEKHFCVSVNAEDDEHERKIAYTDKNGNRISFIIGYSVDKDGATVYTIEKLTIN